MKASEIKKILLSGLTESQKTAVSSTKQSVLVVAGAGSGKTEVMARRVAWWVGIDKVPKENIVAFTFTDRAAEEMKFRIRQWMGRISNTAEETALGGMYIGTIHGFCLAKLREFWPDTYHNFDILDEAARASLILRGFYGILGLAGLQRAWETTHRRIGRYSTVELFCKTYDQLHEHNCFKIKLPEETPPHELGEKEKDWCKKAVLLTNVGDSDDARAFSISAARYYAYLRCRRFLDFSSSQTEMVQSLSMDEERLRILKESGVHLVVDEVQDINPIQMRLIEMIVGDSGKLSAVGDHRQSIYGFRGAKVEIIGTLWNKYRRWKHAEVIDLGGNFRSTPRIINLANCWADTIGKVKGMKTPPMEHGNRGRDDYHDSHLALVSFPDREDEAGWIAKTIRELVPSSSKGVTHDKREGGERGISLADIAILVRSSTHVRSYMQALEELDIPCVVRAGPDLFSQPEVLLFVAALQLTSGGDAFIGSMNEPKSLPNRVRSVLGCGTDPVDVLHHAADALRESGIPCSTEAETRLLNASKAIHTRMHKEGETFSKADVSAFAPDLRDFLTSKNKLRRVFPQKIYHMLLAEAEVGAWDTDEGRGQAALYHLGALSKLITGIETPGWTSLNEYKWQLIGLFQYGAEEGRAEEQPLLASPNAVTMSTIHGAKGLEFAVVFLADVNAHSFPSNYARQPVELPLSGPIIKKIDIEGLRDNPSYDGERRLMYVALTRAERFLFISRSGRRTSRFVRQLLPMVDAVGGHTVDTGDHILSDLHYSDRENRRNFNIMTTFSDLRYYLECPHDFYLRKVLGFAPAIDQAFGYGRGVHNLLRAIHSDPKKWARLAKKDGAVGKELDKLIEQGLFYLRYTTKEPAENMQKKGKMLAENYVHTYINELEHLEFEPEKPFETLLDFCDGDGGALISGAIDILRLDDPPRITLIDFKSGHAESDLHMKLDADEMKLQVGLYAVAAKNELSYEPERGLVRYLDETDPKKAEMGIPLDPEALDSARAGVLETALQIRDRNYFAGPTARPRDPKIKSRCSECDFSGFCGQCRRR